MFPFLTRTIASWLIAMDSCFITNKNVNQEEVTLIEKRKL
jgi:hypothetical protein